ncbi:unnamed protein product [Cladocopium goreaui]|uniref:Ubiquitin homeostasis protein lub1 n=1 Tax=Cladocopium goreaui TaxID=2562237 RepID=A0A9P1DL80_9DINO|nr:unnamed protein product [Cladocopium goreaui]
MDDAMEDDDLAAAMAMSMEVEGPAAKAVRQLREKNSEAQLAEASSIQVLSTLLGNLVKSPSEEKYRRVKLSNKKISMALSCAGAEELLGAAGFAKTEDQLEVPSDSPPEKVKADAEAALEALSFVKGHMVLSAQLRAEGEVRCVTTLASGGLAFGSMDNLIRVYGAPVSGGFSQPRILSGHQRRAGVDGVLALVVMEGDQLVSAGRDGRIIVWKDGVEVADLKGHGEGIQGTNVHVVSSLATDGRSLISGGWDKTVRLWENQSQKFVMAGHDIAVNAVAGLSNGDIVSGSGDQSIGIWRNGQKVMTLQAKQVVRALCALDGSRVAAGSNDGFVRLWDASGKMLAERQVAQSYVLSLSRHGPELAAGCSEGQVVILSTEGLQVKEELQVLGEAYGLSFFPNGDLAVACGDGSCTVWTRSAQRAAGKALRDEFASQAAAVAAASAAAPAASAGASYDFNSTVEFGARKLTLSWNRGEDPKAVADRFLRENGLDARHAGDVIAFVNQSMQQQTIQSAGGKDFNYPVEVADGRRLTISWNRGENPQEVALNFARQHGGIAANELPDIVNFISQVSGSAAPAMSVQPAVPPAMQQQLLQQVMAMGFPEPLARQEFEDVVWMWISYDKLGCQELIKPERHKEKGDTEGEDLPGTIHADVAERRCGLRSLLESIKEVLRKWGCHGLRIRTLGPLDQRVVLVVLLCRQSVMKRTESLRDSGANDRFRDAEMGCPCNRPQRGKGVEQSSTEDLVSQKPANEMDKADMGYVNAELAAAPEKDTQKEHETMHPGPNLAFLPQTNGPVISIEAWYGFIAGVPVNELLHCKAMHVLARDLCEMLSKLGSAANMIVSDIQQNLANAKAVYDEAPDERSTLSAFLELPKGHVGIAKLTWLCRGCEFFLVMLKKIFSENSGNAAVQAYEETLMQYHGWFLQKSLKIALRALPSKDNICQSDGLVLQGRMVNYDVVKPLILKDYCSH